MSEHVIITREPVVNKKRAITANRLIAHGPNIGAVVETLNSLQEEWPTRHTVFVSLARLVPTAELLAWQVADNAMIEIPAQALARPQTLELLPTLRDSGISTCLSWFKPGLDLPDHDWRFVLADARKVPEPAGAPGIPLAWGLDSVEAFQQAVSKGFEGASGWFFLHSASAPKALAPNHAQLVRLISLVRNNADVAEIEALLKQDVAISYKLLRYINSAGFGLMCEIQSFRHAVTILGYSNLSKWLSLLLVTATGDATVQATMQASIARGHFMELLGAGFFPKTESDNLFITGAFSLLPNLLGTSMQAVLEEMSLPENVADALLHESGEFAPLLRLAKAAESFDATHLIKHAEELSLDAERINRALLASLAFADNLQA